MKITLPHAAVESLLIYFDQFLPLSGKEQELVIAKFHPRYYRKHQYVLREGEVCGHFNFVLRGCLRIYKIDEQGDVHILQFAIENWWINDIGSFQSKGASSMYIDALEDTHVLQISHEDLMQLYTLAPKFDKIFRILFENAYARLQKRLLHCISSTAEEQYSHFVKTYPFLLNRLSQIQIAAYLGLTPEFLSRIRRRLSKPSD